MTVFNNLKNIKSIYHNNKEIVAVYAGGKMVYKKDNNGGNTGSEIDPTYNYFVFDTSLFDGNSSNKTTEIKLFEYYDFNWGTITYDYGLTDWGDGTIDSESSHTYANEGVYIVKTRYRLMIDYTLAPIAKNMLVNCLGLSNDIDTKRYYFAHSPNLKTIDASTFDMRNVKTLSHMFYNCTSLVSADLSNWSLDSLGLADTNAYWYEVGDRCTSGMFRNCTSLTSLNLSGWNIKYPGYIYNTEYMFYGCTSLKSLNLSNCSDSIINLFVPLLPTRENNDGIIYVDNIKDTYPSVSGWTYSIYN